MYLYSNQGKTNNIFKVKIFRPLPLSIHNISLYKFRFDSIPIEQGTRSFKVQVVQGSAFIMKIGDILTTTITLK